MLHVTDLAKSDVVLGPTRNRLNDLDYEDRNEVAEIHRDLIRNDDTPYQPKYWPHSVVLYACHTFGVKPVLTKQGRKRVKDAGGIIGIPNPDPTPNSEAPKVEEKKSDGGIIAKDPWAKPGKPKAATPKAAPKGDAPKGDLSEEVIRRIIATEIAKSRDAEEETITDLISGVAFSTAGAVIETQGKRLMERVRAEAQEILSSAVVVRHEVKLPDGEVVDLGENIHAAYPEVLDLASMRKNIAVIGPSGCGKTYLAKQVAKGLGFCTDTQYATVSCTMGMSEGDITVKLLPTGENGRFEPLISDFVRMFGKGGLFLADEWDSTDPNVALKVNQALSNGYIDLPMVGRVERHPDFVMMVAMNTYGTGANRQYVGRSQLDEATLDRFRIGQVEMDYDRSLEEKLIVHRELREKLWGIREAASKHGLRRLVSTRFMLDAQDMISGCGWTVEQVVSKLTTGWSKEERSKVGI